MRFVLPFLAVAMLHAAPAAAQTVDTQFWLGGSAGVDVAPRVPVLVDTALRFGDSADGLYEWARGGFAGYRTAGGVELLAGYQRVTGYADGKVTRTEDRPRQQVNFPAWKLGGATLAGRVRVEERFRSTGSDMGVRVRPQLRFALPLRSGGLALVGFTEAFLELNRTDWGQRTGLRRTRNFLAIEVPLTSELKVQTGYLNQYDFGTDGRRDAMANVVTVAIGAKF